jgi:hypothetical protein
MLNIFDIADVPKVVFRRCDGHAYAFTELSIATVSANIDTLDINGGWSLFPLAVLPGNSTFTMNFTSAQFDADMFAMANKTDYALNSNYAVDTSERHEPDANHQIELLQTPIEGSIYIANLEPITTQSGTVTSGHYLINGKKITFSADDDIDFVDVVYQYTKEVQEAIITNKESAIGECSCIWPVYGSGDDCTESSIVGYYIVKVFRARITTVPGLDSSYKNAATFTFELQALDAKRNDEGAYSTAYYKK